MGRYQEIQSKVEQLRMLPLQASLLDPLLRLIRRRGVSFAQILRVASLVPPLACRVLQEAGRSFSTPAPMFSIEDVARQLGERNFHKLLLEFLQTSELGDDEPGQTANTPVWGENLDERTQTRPWTSSHPERGLWGHSVATALACRLLADHLGAVPPAWAELAGLLHDLGKEALAAADPGSTHKIQAAAIRERLPCIEVERRLKLPSHTFLGHALACRWGFPRGLRAVILRHHEAKPELRGELSAQESLLVDLVIVADGMARRLKLGDPFDALGSPVWGGLTRKRLGLDRKDLTVLSHGLDRAYRETVRDVLGRTIKASSGMPSTAL